MEATGTPSTIAAGEVEHTTPVKVYLRVFLALLVLTVMEYFYAQIFAEWHFGTLVIGLLAMAGVKASLVGLFFMHLIFEGRWKYLMLIPTAFLATIAVTALIPDIAMRQQESPAEDVEEQLMFDPQEPKPALAFVPIENS